MDTAHYHILNLNVSVESDSKELLNRFDQDYGWFRVPSLNGNKSLTFSIHVSSAKTPAVITTRSFNRQPSIINHQSLKGHPSPVSFTLQQIVRTLFSELTDFIVLHAGVLEKDGQALILSGPPGAGKSTLTLGLLERGFRFLSDDFCPMERGTGSVYPFPRSVWVVDPERKMSSPGGRPGKRCITPDQLPGSVCSSPCIPKWLICLDPGQDNTHVYLEAGLKEEGAEAFVLDMAQIEGVNVTRPLPELSEWHIRYPARQGISSRVREVIDRHRDAIWNLYRSDRACPNFDAIPTLGPLSTHEAALRLLGELKQEPHHLTEDTAKEKKAGVLFMELAGLLNGVACSRMTPGSLEEMIQLILCHISQENK